jgi:hypothetical protein
MDKTGYAISDPSTLELTPFRPQGGGSYSSLFMSSVNGQRLIAVRCGKCGAVATVKKGSVSNGSIKENDSIYLRRFERMGWKTHPRSDRKCVCPTCISTAKSHDKFMSETGRSAVVGSGPEDIPPQPEETETMATDSTILEEFPRNREPEDPKQPRSLTVPERTKVRDLLDVYFDAAKGAFTDDYSDQRIGKETDLPWASVAAYREVAYGPLRVDPATQGLRKELTKIGNLAAKLSSDIGKSVDVAAAQETALDELRKMINDFEAKLDKAGL